MSIDHRSVLIEESTAVLDVLRAGPLDSAVPGCPPWTLEDLGHHLAGVQTWAASVVRSGTPDGDGRSPKPGPSVIETLAAATEDVVAALDGADPGAPCWNFCSTAPQVASFWPRRQALEAAVHRWDAASSVSADPNPIPAELAVDVTDEHLSFLLQRAVERDGIELGTVPPDLAVTCLDGGADTALGHWTVGVRDGIVGVVGREANQKAEVSLSGDASAVALFLFGRVPIESVTVTGQAAAWRPLIRM